MCFLCQFSSRTCTAKEKFCQGKEKVKDVAVLMDIEPSGDHDGGNLANEAAPTAKSIKYTHSGPVRMARDNYLPWLEPETLELPPDLISITYLTLFGPCPSPTVGGEPGDTKKWVSHDCSMYCVLRLSLVPKCFGWHLADFILNQDIPCTKSE